MGLINKAKAAAAAEKETVTAKKVEKVETKAAQEVEAKAAQEVETTTAEEVETTTAEEVETTTAEEVETTTAEEVETTTAEEVETTTAEEVETTTAEEVEAKTTSAVQEKAQTGVATVKPKSGVAVQSKNEILAAAEAQGFSGLKLGYGSFPIITLPAEGTFNDSDGGDLGKYIRATIQETTPSFLYKQEDVDKGDVGFSYDGVTITNFTGEEEFKTVEELRSHWEQEGYETEVKEYLEVIGVIDEDLDEDYPNGEVPDALLDLLGEPVIFRIPPGSSKAFSGKIYTLQWSNKPLRGTVMEFKVGAKRTSGRNSYYPWKFSIKK